MALIATNANVEWMCWPFFDKSFIFGGLCDELLEQKPQLDGYLGISRYG